MELSRVLVTGGAGFIGSHLVTELMNKGYSIVVLDNLHSGKIDNLREVSSRNGFKLVRGDVRDRAAVRDAVKDVDAVVHLAALIDVEESVKNPVETYDVNVTGTLNVLLEAVRKGVKRFIYASSTAVYGEANPLPLREDYPPRPESPYGASKASAECFCEAFSRSFGLNTLVLRFFNVYGPGQESNPYSGVVTKFLKNASNGNPLIIYGDGKQTRDFIYIDDVVKAITLALEDDKGSGEIFNVCAGRPVTINELASLVKKILARDAPIIHDGRRKGDIMYNYGDPTRACEVLGFKAEVSLEQGLKRLIDNLIYGHTSSAL
jgi:UDP-glucose 4-epimerase